MRQSMLVFYFLPSNYTPATFSADPFFLPHRHTVRLSFSFFSAGQRPVRPPFPSLTHYSFSTRVPPFGFLAPNPPRLSFLCSYRFFSPTGLSAPLRVIKHFSLYLPVNFLSSNPCVPGRMTSSPRLISSRVYVRVQNLTPFSLYLLSIRRSSFRLRGLRGNCSHFARSPIYTPLVFFAILSVLQFCPGQIDSVSFPR